MNRHPFQPDVQSLFCGNRYYSPQNFQGLFRIQGNFLVKHHKDPAIQCFPGIIPDKKIKGRQVFQDLYIGGHAPPDHMTVPVQKGVLNHLGVAKVIFADKGVKTGNLQV